MNGNGNYFQHDKDYHFKVGQAVREDAWQWLVRLEFYATPQERTECREKQFYFRTAYRNSPDFTINHLERLGEIAKEKIAAKMIENDECVSVNYQRAVSSTIAHKRHGSLQAIEAGCVWRVTLFSQAGRHRISSPDFFAISIPRGIVAGVPDTYLSSACR